MYNPSTWDNVPVNKKGKLVGILTDDLARNIFSFPNRLKSINSNKTSALEIVRIRYTSKVGRKMPSKLK